jgi:hypothetical protein
MIAFLLALLLQPASLDLRLAAVGRDAVFVETNGMTQSGPKRAFRILRIVPGGEPIGGELFYGGWQQVNLDCEAKTFTGLTFQSLRESGVAGPEQPSRRIQALPIAGGSIEEGLRQAVCEGSYRFGDRAASVPEAAKIGRQRIEDEIDRQIDQGRS